jgi:hypothetical protein
MTNFVTGSIVAIDFAVSRPESSGAVGLGASLDSSQEEPVLRVELMTTLDGRDAAREFRDLTSILIFSSCRHSANSKAVSEDNEVAGNGWNTGARQDHPDEIQRIAGRELDFRRASRSVTHPDRTKRLYGFRQGELLADEPADEPPASHLASHLHPSIPNEEIPPRPNQ